MLRNIESFFASKQTQTHHNEISGMKERITHRHPSAMMKDAPKQCRNVNNLQPGFHINYPALHFYWVRILLFSAALT